MSTMTITIERTPRTLQFGDTTLQVEELSVRLPFARKPADLSDAVHARHMAILQAAVRADQSPPPLNDASASSRPLIRRT